MGLFDRSRVTLAIEWGSARMMSVSGRRVVKWGRAPLGEALVRGGLILQPEAVGEAIRKAMDEMHLPRTGVAVSLTGLGSVWRIVNVPKADRRLTEMAILREASKLMPTSLDSLYLSWQCVGEKEGFRRFFVLGVPRDTLDSHMEALKCGDIQAFSMDLKPLALIRAVNRRDALIVDVEPAGLCIAICTGGVPMAMRTLEIEPDQGEVEEGAEEIAQEISKTIKFYNQSCGEAPMPEESPIYLTGEFADDPLFARTLEGYAKRPVEFASPPLVLPDDMPLGAFSVGIGLALKSGDGWWKKLRP